MKIVKLTLRILLVLLIVISVIITLVVGKNKILSDKVVANEKGYKGVISLWQIDSFEGGAGSRKQFLLEVCREFELKHEGVLIMVTNQSVESVEKNYQNGRTSDLVSFGLGVQIKNANSLEKVNGFSGGKVGKKTYAVPWCRGGYAIISNPKVANENIQKEDVVVVSQADYTQPLLALACEEITLNNFKVLPPMDAYMEFVSGKAQHLIGTQRDVVRLNRRGMEVNIKPLTEFNDLYQYIAVTSKDGGKGYYAEEFIKFLTSTPVQKKLNKICMMSATTTVNFNEEGLNLMQKSSHKKTLSAFTNIETLKEYQRISKEYFESGKSGSEIVNKTSLLLI